MTACRGVAQSSRWFLALFEGNRCRPALVTNVAVAMAHAHATAAGTGSFMMPCKEAGVWYVAVAAGEGNHWVYDGDKVDGEKKIVQIDMWIDSSFSFEKLLERVWQVSGLAPEGLVGASASPPCKFNTK